MNTHEGSKIYDFVGRAKGSGAEEDRQQRNNEGSGAGGRGTAFSFPIPAYDLEHIHIAQAALAVKDKAKSETEARHDLVEGHESKFKGILADEGKAIVGRVKHLEIEIDHVEKAIDSEANELASTAQGDFQQIQKASLEWTSAAVLETMIYGVMFCAVVIWGFWANFSYFRGAGGGSFWEAFGVSLISFVAGAGFKYLHSRETDPVRKKRIGTLSAVIGMVGVACFYAGTGMSEAADAGISSQTLFQGTGEETSGFSIAAKILKPIGQVLAEAGLGVITLTMLLESLATYGKNRTVSEFVPNPVFLALKAKYETNQRTLVSLQGEKKHLEEWISAQEKLIAGRLAEVTAQFQYQLSH